ncbi:MAG: RelA/SpoT family protein [Bacteroidota bacterium]
MQNTDITYTPEEMRDIRQAYDDMILCIKSAYSEDDEQQMFRAFEIAADAHKKQRRKSGEPYIFHPIAVARICAEEIGLGPTAIVCALLHDVVEDTPVTLEEIRKEFGNKFAMIVDGLTKLDGLHNAPSQQAENFKKVLTTLTDDVRVVLIKMADRLHNMRTLDAMPRHKQLKIAAETSFIYTPLAHRLGLYQIKTEYQDLCMKITNRDTYSEIARKLQETKRARTAFVESFIQPLDDALKAAGFKNYKIFGRPKSIYSIWNKIKKKKVKFEEIYDLFAVRIILSVPRTQEKQKCWQVYSIVTDVHTPIPERLRDWVTTPKSNGYESLHTTVIGPDGRYVEVQIRSVRMDEIAERGFAAHWKYKGVKGDKYNVFDAWLNSVRDILDIQDGDAIQFIEDFKTNLFNEEVYVYTPKGDMKILPKGATALDFAFSIHTDIGYHCQAVKVNKKLVPMGYKLQSGDQVSVITNKNQKPSEAWLKMVVTGRARSKIRSAMKEEKRKQGEFGKEAMMRKFRNLKIDYEENVDTLVNYFKLQSRVDLCYAIAMEEINLNNVLKNFKVENNKLVEIPEEVEEPTPIPTEKKRSKKKQKYEGKPQLRVGGQNAEEYSYQLASCCNPVQGDDVFAYLTATAGLKIHRTSCPNATHLMAHYGYRVMKAEWVNTTDTNFIAELRIVGIDSGPGVIQQLSNKISNNLGLNIRSFYIDGNEGYFEGKVSILIKNKDQLEIAIRALKDEPGITSVTRVE